MEFVLTFSNGKRRRLTENFNLRAKQKIVVYSKSKCLHVDKPAALVGETLRLSCENSDFQQIALCEESGWTTIVPCEPNQIEKADTPIVEAPAGNLSLALSAPVFVNLQNECLGTHLNFAQFHKNGFYFINKSVPFVNVF